MNRINVRSSLGMLFPAPRNIILAGERFRVVELQLDRIGILERFAARWAKHPEAAVQHHIDGMEAATIGTPEWREHARAVSTASTSWPPTMGAEIFSRAMASPRGMTLFLAVMLKKFQPRLKSGYIRDVALAMDEAEWRRLEAVAWGFQDWETPNPQADPTNKPGRGVDWGEAFDFLVEKVGIPPKDIADLYVSQFLAIQSNGKPHGAYLPEWKPTDGA